MDVDDIVHLLEGEEGDDQEWKFWLAALIKRAPFVGLEGKRADFPLWVKDWDVWAVVMEVEVACVPWAFSFVLKWNC